MSLEIVQGDITKMQVDAIVNTANRRPIVGEGADQAIHTAAGPQLLEARRKIGVIPSGGAAITPGFNLPSRYVIHTVGVHWNDGCHGELAILRSCYMSTLQLAVEHKCRSIAFPLLSSGNHGFPRQIALQVAQGVLQEFAASHEDIRLLLVLRRPQNMPNRADIIHRSYRTLAEHLPTDADETLASFLRSEYPAIYGAPDALEPYLLQGITWNTPEEERPAGPLKLEDALQASVRHAEETFSDALRRIMLDKDLYPTDVYKPVFMSKSLFSAIYNNRNYQPSKKTALLLVLGLQLNLQEAEDFIAKAGFTLSDSILTDIVVKQYVAHGNYAVLELDNTLFDLGLDTLTNSKG